MRTSPISTVAFAWRDRKRNSGRDPYYNILKSLHANQRDSCARARQRYDDE